MKVVIAGEYEDNYLTLGERVYHVPPETIEAAIAEADAVTHRSPTPPDAPSSGPADSPPPSPPEIPLGPPSPEPEEPETESRSRRRKSR